MPQVVDGGNGQVALWNEHARMYIRLTTSDPLEQLGIAVFLPWETWEYRGKLFFNP